MQKITIKGINHKELSRNDGTGTFETCGILIDTDQGEKWINGYGSPRTHALNKGETILVHLYDKEYNGKTETRFTLPSLDALMCR